MNALANPKVSEFVARGRFNFVEQRADFYRKHEKAGLIDEVNSAISQRVAPDIPTLKQHSLIGNSRFRGIVDHFENDVSGERLSDPRPGEFDQANKACVDARSLTEIVYDYLERKIITERTAASIVRTAHAFKELGDDGVGFVIVHDSCGGLQAAHDYYSGKLHGPPDEHLKLLLEGGVHPVIALMEDPQRRSEHGISQAEMANLAITGSRSITKVFPVCSILNGGDDAVISGVEWLGGPVVHKYAEQMDYAARTLWSIAAGLGRKKKQFAHTIYFYDAERLGRFPDPRIFFDELPNGSVCVTFSARDLLSGKGLSKNAIASIKYAAFHDGGHIDGVGGPNGNRHIMVIDPDPEVTMLVEAALLNSCPTIRNLTRNGETIIQTKYDLRTRMAEFLD